MRRFLIAAASLGAALTWQGAGAADLAPVYKAPSTYSWSGVYAGLNAGYGWGTFTPSGNASIDFNGFVGGGQVGANWQSGALVLGVEADFQATTQDNNQTIGIATVKDSLPWFGTVRGRVGYALDRWMIYATGGYAYMQTKIEASALGVTLSSSANTSGWALGGGVEWAAWDRWTIKAEYLFLDTGNTTVTLFGAPVSGRGTDSVARVGLNYHF